MSIDERLAVIETTLTARDERDQERWNYIKMKLNEMPCQVHMAQMNSNTSFRKNATKGLWISFSAIVGLIIKAVFWD
jgi:hypothetical protein